MSFCHETPCIVLFNSQSLREAPFYWKWLLIGIVNVKGLEKSLHLTSRWTHPLPAPPTPPLIRVV